MKKHLILITGTIIAWLASFAVVVAMLPTMPIWLQGIFAALPVSALVFDSPHLLEIPFRWGQHIAEWVFIGVIKSCRLLAFVPFMSYAFVPLVNMLERIGVWGGILKANVARRATADVVEDESQMRQFSRSYDPEKLINLRKGIFLGLAGDGPVYIPQAILMKNHWEILGESGVGKSSIAGVMLSQLAEAGETVIIFDPKNDANLSSVLARRAALAGVPMTLLDLRITAAPQFNPLAGCRPDQVEELLQIAIELGKSGNASVDYYRGEDRDKAELLASYYRQGATCLPELIEVAAGDTNITAATNLWRELRQLGRLPVFNTDHDLRLAELVQRGGIIYVVGSTTDLKVHAAQRLLLQRFLQILEDRSDRRRPVCLFLDELKYLLSPAALRAAGTIRDRNCHLVFAHQSLGDLHDVPGLDPKAVVGAVWGNSSVRIAYKTPDVETCQKLSILGGVERAWSEQSSKTRAHVLIEEGGWRETERPRLPAHTFSHLPKPSGDESSVGVVFGIGPAFFLATHWLKSGPAPAAVAVAPYISKTTGKTVATNPTDMI